MDSILETLKVIYNALVSALEAVIKGIIDAVVTPIKNALAGWGRSINSAIQTGFGVFFDDDPDNDKEFNAITASVGVLDAVLSAEFWIIMGLVFALEFAVPIAKLIMGILSGGTTLTAGAVASAFSQVWMHKLVF